MQLNNADILSIELLHPLDQPPAFFHRLQQSVINAQAIRGAVAFWTIDPNLVTPSLSERLAATNGFLCVDLHLPTSVEMLAHLYQQMKLTDPTGKHLYLHLRDLEGVTEIRSGNTGMPEHLLHTKSMLFDFNDGTAEVWIGSHNWTRRALVGLNIEASIVVRVAQSSELYHQTVRMLEQIRRLCQPFNPGDAHYYRWLQGLEQAVPILELEGPKAGKLANQEIKLFGTNAADFKQLRTVGYKIYVRVKDTKTKKWSLYRAEIVTASDSAIDIKRLVDGLQAEQQRYVVRQGQHLPHLELPLTTPASLPPIAYCGSIAIKELLPLNSRVVDPPGEERWISTNDDHLLERLRNYQYPLLAEVSSEYGLAVSEVLTKVKMRLPATLSPRKTDRSKGNEKPTDPGEQPLFTRKLLEVPEKDRR